MEEEYSFLIDTDRRVVAWGEEIGRLTGNEASAAVGKVYDAVFPRLLSGDEDAVSLALAGNGKVVIKGCRLTCPGEFVTADIFINPVSEGDIVSGAKVTVSRVMCPALQNQGNTRGFTDIGKTASTIAHGVRNPLNAMKGAVLYLSEKYQDEPNLPEFAKIMEEEITRFDRFISKFLSTSVSDMESSLTDVNTLLAKIRILTSFQTRSYGIKTIYHYGDVPPVLVNSFQLQHAVLNVINNAIEMMRSGGTLTVKTKAENCSGAPCIAIEVLDTGPGIGGRRKVFLEDGGKGFGLLITREILRYYGGHLEIKNRRHGGTAAYMYLSIERGGKK